MFGTSRGANVWRALDPMISELVEKGISHDGIAQALANAVPGAVEESAALLARVLHARAPELAEQRRFLAAFRKRLGARWGKAFTLYEMVLTGAAEAGEDFRRSFGRVAARDHDLRFDVLGRLHARACLVAAEVFELLKGGFPHGAQARCRTLHELAVFAIVIGEHDQEVAERFLLHDLIENSENADIYQAYAERLGEKPLSKAGLDRIHAHRDAAIRRFGKRFKGRYGWAASLFPGKDPPTFGRLQTLASLAFWRPFYDLSTHLGVHASSKGARLNIVPAHRGKVLLAGPTNAGLADPGQEALISLLQVTTTLLTKGRPLQADPIPLIVARTLAKLVDDAEVEFMRAHHKLEADERRARSRKRTSGRR